MKKKTCKIFYNILENSKNIKELHLLEHMNPNFFDESEESEEKQEDEDNNKNEEENIKKLLNIINNINSLKYINLDLDIKDSNFISYFLKEYKNNNLIKFKSNIYNSNNIKIFQENNSNIEKIDLDFRKNEGGSGQNCILKNEKIKIKKLILDGLNTDFYIYPAQIEVIKLNYFELIEKSINIFFDENNLFYNLREFHLMNKSLESNKNYLSKLLKILNTFKKLEIVKILDKAIDDNLIISFIENNRLNLSTLFLGSRSNDYLFNEIKTEYYLELYPSLKSIGELTIILERNYEY